MARPEKYKPEFCNTARDLLANGATEEFVAIELGISLASLKNYKNKYPEFLAAIRAGLDIQVSNVEGALYKRAVGYAAPDTKAQWVQDSDGGHWKYAEMEKHYPPDEPSIRFYLKNKKPDEWKDRRDMALGSEDEEGKFIPVVNLVFQKNGSS